MFNTQDTAFNSTVHSLIHISREMVDMAVCILALRSSISLLLCYRHALSPCPVTRSRNVSDPWNMQAITMSHYELSIDVEKLRTVRVK